MQHRTVRLLLLLGFLLLLPQSMSVSAQTVTVLFDAQTGTTPATANTWTSVLYVNGTPFPMTHTCVAVGTVTTCSAPLPAIAPALTSNGSQSFTVTFKDAVLGETTQSSPPLVRIRPSAAINLRIQ